MIRSLFNKLSKLSNSSTKKVDSFDQLNLSGLSEDCGPLVDQVLKKQQQNYYDDPEMKKLLDSLYHSPDPHTNFSNFQKSREWNALLRILKLFGVKHSSKIVEVGGGSGFLIYALHKCGFSNLTMFEPSKGIINGPGFLKTLPESKNIEIFEDLEDWQLSSQKFEVVITKGCLHHFRNIAYVAAMIRQKIEIGGLWFVAREWFADDASELASNLHSHPYCQSFKMYEWAFPAYHYVDALESIGMQLIAVAPLSYDDMALHQLAEGKQQSKESKEKTFQFDQILLNNPQQTVENFWNEVKANKFEGQTLMEYTRPSLMVFQKVLVE